MSDLSEAVYDFHYYDQFLTGFESLLSRVDTSSIRNDSSATMTEKYALGVFKAHDVSFQDCVGVEGFLGKGGDTFFKMVKGALETIGDIITAPLIFSSNLGFKAGLKINITDPIMLANLTILSDADYLAAIRKPDEVIKEETKNSEQYHYKDNSRYVRAITLKAVAKAAKEKKTLAKHLENVTNLSALIKDNLKKITLPEVDMSAPKKYKELLVVEHKKVVGEFIEKIEKSQAFLEEKSYEIREVVSLKVDPDDILKKAKKTYSSSDTSDLSDIAYFQQLTDNIKIDVARIKEATRKTEHSSNTSKEAIDGIAAATKLLTIISKAIIPVEAYYDKLNQAYNKIVIRNALLKLTLIERSAMITS